MFCNIIFLYNVSLSLFFWLTDMENRSCHRISVRSYAMLVSSLRAIRRKLEESSLLFFFLTKELAIKIDFFCSFCWIKGFWVEYRKWDIKVENVLSPLITQSSFSHLPYLSYSSSSQLFIVLLRGFRVFQWWPSTSYDNKMSLLVFVGLFITSFQCSR